MNTNQDIFLEKHSPVKIGNHSVPGYAGIPCRRYSTENGNVYIIASEPHEGHIVVVEDLKNNKSYGYTSVNDEDYKFIDSIKESFGKFSLTQSKDDIYLKAYAVLDGNPYEDTVIMKFDLDDETCDFIYKFAKSENISVDEVIIRALKIAITEKGNANDNI